MKLVSAVLTLFLPSAFAVALLATAASPNAQAGDAIEIEATQIENLYLASTSDRMGDLKFVGGLELASDDARFGGFSGLRLSPDGSTLYTVSDAAWWLTARIDRDDQDRLSGVSSAKIACLCRSDGTRYGSKHWGDSEGLDIVGSTAFVVFERLNRVNRYRMDGEGLPGKPANASAAFRPFSVAYNEGLEAIAVFPQGSRFSGKFIAIAEESLNAQGHHRAFIGDETSIEELAIERRDEYAVTDAAFLPDGDLIILERRFNFSSGLNMRLSVIDARTIEPGALLVPRLLGEANLSARIDNMEGVATWRDAQGRIRLTLISDDNYNRTLQRTLLLEFVLTD